MLHFPKDESDGSMDTLDELLDGDDDGCDPWVSTSEVVACDVIIQCNDEAVPLKGCCGRGRGRGGIQ